jgi:UPF0271 protein
MAAASSHADMTDGEPVRRVLDTSALLHWPIEELAMGSVVPAQLREVERFSQERALLLEGTTLDWREPSGTALARARDIARSTGDLAGLSPTDVSLLALALEMDAELVTDDYRLMNCAESAGIPYRAVLTEGISERRQWRLMCRACGHQAAAAEQESESRQKTTECPECGNEMRLSSR